MAKKAPEESRVRVKRYLNRKEQAQMIQELRATVKRLEGSGGSPIGRQSRHKDKGVMTDRAKDETSMIIKN